MNIQIVKILYAKAPAHGSMRIGLNCSFPVLFGNTKETTVFKPKLFR